MTTVLEDADDDLAGYQVDFNADVPSIRLRIVSEDGDLHHTYTISDLAIRYDVNDNGAIDKDEALTAIGDYFGGIINRYEAIGVLRLYFYN